MGKIYYCKKCARKIYYYNYKDEKCDYCQSKFYPVPDEYLNDSKTRFKNGAVEDKFMNDYVKSLPEFDQDACDYRLEKRLQGDLRMKRILSESKNPSRKQGCPTCGSTSIQKIGGLERGASIAMLGLFSKKIGKQFKCNSCGYMW